MGDAQLFIDGAWVNAQSGETFPTYAPSTGEKIADVAKAGREDARRAVEAARKAFDDGPWSKMSGRERASKLRAAAEIINGRSAEIAEIEARDGGGTIKKAMFADVPGAVSTFQAFADCAENEPDVIERGESPFPPAKSIVRREPFGVCSGIVPWNFPFLMAGWKIGPAIAAGNCVVLKPAEQTPASILVWAELVGDLLPPGILNIVNGFGLEAGKPLASSSRVAKIAFTGETTTGRLIMQYASQNLIPVTLELGGKSPNIFFSDVCQEDDDFFDKAIEGFVMFALNQGEVCTCPSRALIQESIYDKFMERALKRVAAIKQANPLESDTMIGAQVSSEQLEKILSYIDIGHKEGAELLAGGGRAKLGGELDGGYYIQPTVFRGHNRMRIFQEEIFGPVVSVTTFKNESDALEIANDTLYGLGAGLWTRDINRCHRLGRGIQAGRVWINCYHAYPAHAAFGGYKQSGIGRETHSMMLDHYQQTKNLLVSYSPKKLGFF
jgi:aldehyde dehydrogenase